MPQTTPLSKREVAAQRLLRMHFESKVGHLGGNLSALDILLALYHDVLRDDDQFVLSKGHSAGALYVTLWSLDRITDEQLKTFHRDGTSLSGHPPASGIPEILFATGSLGHGPSLASGLALAKQLKNEAGRVFCVTSDGEWNEGSCWEAVIFARHRELNNLTLVVDLNGLQGFGTTAEVADMEPFADKFRAFRWEVFEVDGHNQSEIAKILQSPQDRPRVVIAKTNKGRGVSFMQDRMEWHYLPLSEDQYQLAVAERGST
jgi:transketolase